MPVEFDPTTSTYYQTSYTGAAAPSEPVESPPPAQAQAPPPPPEEEAKPFVDLPPPPQDPSLQRPDAAGYPGGYKGSVVDEVV
jgi:hypothetical protein